MSEDIYGERNKSTEQRGWSWDFISDGVRRYEVGITQPYLASTAL